MTLREYIENNAEDILAELCQYQDCDNCSIRAVLAERGIERCILKDEPAYYAIDIDLDTYNEEDHDCEEEIDD